METLPGRSERAVITHSALSNALEPIFQAVTTNAPLAARWTEATGLDCSNRAALSTLLLGYCLQANPDGIVLFHSNSAAHITANIQAAGSAGPSADAIRAFADLVAAAPFRSSLPSSLAATL